MKVDLAAGSADDPDVCNAWFASNEAEVDGRAVWQLEVTLLSLSAGRARLQVHWTKTVRDGAEPDVRKEETREVQLGPTDYHVLDYAENPRNSPSPCASLLVRLTAVPRPVPSVAHTATVDLWIVEEADGRPARAVHERIVGAVGDQVPFQMFTLTYPITRGDGSADQPAVHLGVSGTLRLVGASDGLVDITLNAWRKFSYADMWVRGEGRTQFRAAVGDAVALMLPDPTGTLVGAVPEFAQLAEGVARRDRFASIDLRRLFAGRRLALYVKVDSVR